MNNILNYFSFINEDFNYNYEDEKIKISINGVGEIILIETTPKYEFVEDITEEELEKLGIDEDEPILKIEHIEINDEYKNMGYGNLLMKEAMKYVDKNNYNIIYLNASPIGFNGLNLKDLTKFYKKFNFEVFKNQGNNNLMIRYGKNNN